CGERACPALGCEAAPFSLTAFYQMKLGAWFWGRFALQRGASPLATTSLLTTTSPLTRKPILQGIRYIQLKGYFAWLISII
ncbi:hypothetical protein, partial [Pseudomonas azotoformans]